jgi:hypothetical protein
MKFAQHNSAEVENDSMGEAHPAAINTTTVLALVLLIFSFLRTWDYSAVSAAGVDFYQFWAVAQTVAKSSAVKIYSEDARAQIGRAFYERAHSQAGSDRERAAADYRRVLETYSSPFLYSFFRLFSLRTYETSFRIYLLVCLICSAVSILALCNSFRYPFLTSLLAIAVFMEWFEPLLSDIRVGNVNQLQLGMLGLYVWLQSRDELRQRHLIGGIVLGLGIMFKLNLAFVVGMLSLAWLINGRFRKLLEQYLGIGLASLTAFAVSSIYFRSATVWVDWLASLKSLPDSITTIRMGNCSLNRLIADVAGLELGTYICMVLVALTAAFLWAGRRNRQPSAQAENLDTPRAFEEDSLMVGIGCLIYLIAARLVWLHYMILVVPVVLFLLRPREQGSLETRSSSKTYLLTGLATLLIGINPFTSIFRGPFVPVIIVCIGLIMLFGLGIGKIWQLRRARSGAIHHT